MKAYLLIVLSFVMLACKSVKTEETAYLSFRASQKSFETKDGVIKYVDQGKGDKVIVLLHGVPCSSWIYRKMIPLLVKKGYRVIAPDMLGFGSSDNPKGYELYNNRSHATRFLALMDALNIKTWHHVMHDVGGLWTWEIFKQAPKRIDKITVLNTIIFEEGFHPPVRMKKGAFSKIAMWMYNNNITTSTMLKLFYKEALKDTDLLTAQEKYGYKKPMLENKTRGMYYFLTQTCNKIPDYRGVFKSIDVPVQFVWGKHDKMLRIEDQLEHIKTYFKTLNKQVNILDANHLIQEEMPQQIVDLILELEDRTVLIKDDVI